MLGEIAQVISVLGALLLELIMSFVVLYFDSSLVAASFLQVGQKLAFWDDFRQSLREAAGEVIGFLNSLTDWMSFTWPTLDFLDFEDLEDICLGFVHFFRSLAAIALLIGIVMFLQGDVLFRVLITANKMAKGKSKLTFMIFKKLQESVVKFMLMVLQTAVITCQVMLWRPFFDMSALGGHTNQCPLQVFYFVFYVALLWPFLFLYLATSFFSGRKDVFGRTVDPFIPSMNESTCERWLRVIMTFWANCIKQFLICVPRFLLLAMGSWSNYSVELFEVTQRARELDDDPTDDDRHYEQILSYTGKINGMYFLLWPGCAFATKAADYFNESIIFTDLKLETSPAKRGLMWMFNFSKFVCVMVLATNPGAGAWIVGYLASIFPKVFSAGEKIHQVFSGNNRVHPTDQRTWQQAV